MSLWTPGGEHQVPRGESSGAGTSAPADWRDKLAAGELELDDLTPEQRAEVEAAVAEMAEAQQQLVSTPVEQIIAQHVIGLRELAILHLQQPAPDFEVSKVAIDAIRGIVEATGGRLGELDQPLRHDLQQLELAFITERDRAQGGEADDAS